MLIFMFSDHTSIIETDNSLYSENSLVIANNSKTTKAKEK
jgi:hypothetical protein